MAEKDTIPVIRTISPEELLSEIKSNNVNFANIICLNADFRGKEIEDIDFSGAKMLNCNFSNCRLNECNFSRAELSESSFERSTVESCTFFKSSLAFADFGGAVINDSDFTDANLSHARLDTAKISNTIISLPEKAPSAAAKITASSVIEQYEHGRRDFSGAEIYNGDFNSKVLKGIIFRNARLHHADFNHADLTNSDFSCADLTNSRFCGTILRHANFSRTNLYLALISDAFLGDTNFENASFLWAKIKNINFTLAKTQGAILSWVLMIDTKMTDSQFFSLPPNVLETMKIESTSKDNTKSSTGSEEPYETTHAPYAGNIGQYSRGAPYAPKDSTYIVSTNFDVYRKENISVYKK